MGIIFKNGDGKKEEKMYDKTCPLLYCHIDVDQKYIHNHKLKKKTIRGWKSRKLNLSLLTPVDLRQDMLTLQMIQLMENMWKKEGLDLR